MLTTTHSRVLSLSAVVIVVVLVLAYEVWWSRPQVFFGWGGESAVGSKVGEVQNFNMFVSLSDERVTLHDIRPVIATNTADADIELVVCRSRFAKSQLGSDTGSLDPYCSAVLPTSSFDPVRRRDALMVRITPRRPGLVQVDGVEVHYSRGWKHLWQTGTDQTGIGVKVPVR